MSEKDFDLICIGRSCVDLYSGEFGVPLERAMTFTKSVGGSPMNIAIGTSRLGLRVGAITGVGQEDNGRYLKWQLSCEGVDVSAVKTDPKRLTAITTSRSSSTGKTAPTWAWPPRISTLTIWPGPGPYW